MATSGSDPAPYRPFVKPAGGIGGPVDDPARPWLALRPGETERERHTRLSKTCYHCGVFMMDSAVLDVHEAEH